MILQPAKHVCSDSHQNWFTARDANATELEGRTNKICFRGPDIILAVGNEIRITNATDGAKPDLSSESKAKPYKVCSLV